jgi:hypothetical protein
VKHVSGKYPNGGKVMDKELKEKKNFTAAISAFVKKAWRQLILIAAALVVIVVGIFVNSALSSTNRADISLYNKAVETYNLPPQLLPATDDRPSEYPIVRAVAYFEQAYAKSTDDNVKALILYNLGTLMGKDGLTYLTGGTPFFSIKDGISKLEESIRLNPKNENAKYNLELLEKALAILEPGGEAIGDKVPGTMGGMAGYASGAVYKGY